MLKKPETTIRFSLNVDGTPTGETLVLSRPTDFVHIARVKASLRHAINTWMSTEFYKRLMARNVLEALATGGNEEAAAELAELDGDWSVPESDVCAQEMFAAVGMEETLALVTGYEPAEGGEAMTAGEAGVALRSAPEYRATLIDLRDLVFLGFAKAEVADEETGPDAG